MLTIRQVDRKDALDMLPFVFTYLARALRHDNSEGTVEMLSLEIVEGGLILWLVYDDEEKRLCGAVTTGFVKYPRKLSMELRTVTIDAPRSEWLPLFKTLEKFAAAFGCYDIETTGRVGLEKLTPMAGFRKTHVKMTKRVKYEQ